MRPFYRLYSKLSAAVLLLFTVLGAVLLYTNSITSERYALEVTQRLNRDIAIHAAEDMALFENGQVNQVALKELAHHVMFMNPIVEVYLLDLQGNILSHALPYETVLALGAPAAVAELAIGSGRWLMDNRILQTRSPTPDDPLTSLPPKCGLLCHHAR